MRKGEEGRRREQERKGMRRRGGKNKGVRGEIRREEDARIGDG